MTDPASPSDAYPEKCHYRYKSLMLCQSSQRNIRAVGDTGLYSGHERTGTPWRRDRHRSALVDTRSGTLPETSVGNGREQPTTAGYACEGPVTDRWISSGTCPVPIRAHTSVAGGRTGTQRRLTHGSGQCFPPVASCMGTGRSPWTAQLSACRGRDLGSCHELSNSMVPRVGLEPTRCHHHRILSPARLPIPPSRQ